MSSLEPALQAVLLSGAAQLLFFTRVPAYAVVNESVELAVTTIRPGAGRLVNAVLRKLAELPAGVSACEDWSMASNQLPLSEGCLLLKRSCLPDQAEDWKKHLSIASSHPYWLIDRWSDRWSRGQVMEICRHNLMTVPIIVAVGADFERGGSCDEYQAHGLPGFIVWRGSHECLKNHLTEHPHHRVQDPASSRAVETTRGLRLENILDYCAGRGTKTRQLALLHDHACLSAWEVDADRRRELSGAVTYQSNIRTVSSSHAIRKCYYDLVVVDVPCSNSGVLARRPEAKYRLNQGTLRSLVDLQRRILEEAYVSVKAGGYILYSTCSLEPEENEHQVRRFLSQHSGELLDERLHIPCGTCVEGYHDGAYHALFRVKIDR